LSEGELASLLLSSPLYQKIEGIKSLLSGSAGKGGASYSAPGKKKQKTKTHTQKKSNIVACYVL